MLPHAVPSDAQRRHWYVKDVGAPVHVPSDAVSVEPSLAVPLICGTAVFWGAAAERANATEPASPQATIRARTGRSRRRPIGIFIGVSLVGFTTDGLPLENV